jgi:hypothetical protein
MVGPVESRDVAGYREVVNSYGAKRIMAATSLRKGETVYTAREDGCACRFAERMLKSSWVVTSGKLKEQTVEEILRGRFGLPEPSKAGLITIRKKSMTAETLRLAY